MSDVAAPTSATSPVPDESGDGDNVPPQTTTPIAYWPTNRSPFDTPFFSEYQGRSYRDEFPIGPDVIVIDGGENENQ